MAEPRSAKGAYWFGALMGLTVSGGVAAYLSLTTPLSEAAPEAGETVAAKPPAPVATREEIAATLAVEEAAAPAAEEPTEDEVAAVEPVSEEQAVEESAPEEPVAEPSAPEVAPVEAEPPAPEAEAPEEAPARAEAEAEPEPEEIAPETVAETAAEPLDEGAPAVRYLEANSAVYDGDLSKPLLSIVLTGAGEGRQADLEEILQLDKRVAIVVSPGASDKAAVASRLKEAGAEVLAGWRQEGGSLAESGPVIGAAVLSATTADEALQINKNLLSNGAALVDLSQPEGGAPYRLSVWMDLPSTSAESRIDEIDNSELVYQALERAAEKASEAGAVVVSGAASPAVLSGVRRWMSVKAGLAVDVAPISVAIRKLSE